MKKIVALLTIVLVLGLTTHAMAKVVFNFGHSNPGTDRSQNHAFYLKFAELAKTYSNGEIVINEFPSNQLGSEQVRVQKARTQPRLITQASTPNVSPFAPSAGVLTLPYLFNTMDEVRTLLQSDFELLLSEKIRKESGLRVLCYLTTGFRMITNSKKPIETMEDLKGLKIRVPKDAIMLETFKAWGTGPITMAWAEVFTALQQGVIDGQINSYITNLAANFHEVQKYITPLSVTPWISPILISDKGFTRLDPKIQTALLKAAKEAGLFEQEWGFQKEEASRKILVDNGMVMGALKDEPKWRDNARALWPGLYKTLGGKELCDLALQYMK